MSKLIRPALVGLLAGAAAIAVFFNAIVVPAKAWSGCGAGVYGGIVNADVDFGSPINFGANGQVAGVTGGCDYRMGQFLIGAGAGYGWLFGDLETLGAKNEIDVFGRAGILVNPTSLVYGHAGWTQLQATGIDIDGWKLGGGIEIKLGDSPLYLDTRYSYAMYDIDKIVPPSFGVEARAHTIRLGLNFKFGPAYQPPGLVEAPSAPTPQAVPAPKAKR